MKNLKLYMILNRQLDRPTECPNFLLNIFKYLTKSRCTMTQINKCSKNRIKIRNVSSLPLHSSKITQILLFFINIFVTRIPFYANVLLNSVQEVVYRRRRIYRQHHTLCTYLMTCSNMICSVFVQIKTR